jgi:hypothetical protein
MMCKVCPVSVNVTQINVLSNLRENITNKKGVKSIMLLYKNNLHDLYFLVLQKRLKRVTLSNTSILND